MPINAYCSKCNQHWPCADELAGQAVDCPQCGDYLPVPRRNMTEAGLASIDDYQPDPPPAASFRILFWAIAAILTFAVICDLGFAMNLLRLEALEASTIAEARRVSKGRPVNLPASYDEARWSIQRVNLVIVILANIGMFVQAVLFLIYLYKCWSLIHDGRRTRTTPDRAVGFLFIPLFNYYWMFVALGSLPGEMNAYAKRHQIPARHAYGLPAMLACVLFILLVIPVFRWVILLPFAMLYLFTLWQAQNAAVDIIAARTAPVVLPA